jgi:uncharacterized membrane protein
MIYMKNLNDLLKAEKRHQLLLGVVFVIYILMNTRTPQTLAGLVDNLYGNIAVVVIALSVFAHSNPVVGILALVAAYELIKRSNVDTGDHAVRNYLPSEKSKVMDFSRYNDFPVTLEEQVVTKMAPLVKHDAPPNSNYKPVLNALHDASPINYEGVI